MYEYIVNPIDNKINNIRSKKGKEIIYKYLSILNGGSGRRMVASTSKANKKKDTVVRIYNKQTYPINFLITYFNKTFSPTADEFLLGFQQLTRELKDGEYYLQTLSIEQCKEKNIDQKQFSDINNGALYLNIGIHRERKGYPPLKYAVSEMIHHNVTLKIGRNIINYLIKKNPFTGGKKKEGDRYDLDIFFFTVLTEHYFDKSTPFELINKLFSLQEQLIDIYRTANNNDSFTYKEVHHFLVTHIGSNDSDDTIDKIIITMTALLNIKTFISYEDHDSVLDAFKQYFSDSSIPNETRLERIQLLKETRADMQTKKEVKNILDIQEIKEFFLTIDELEKKLEGDPATMDLQVIEKDKPSSAATSDDSPRYFIKFNKNLQHLVDEYNNGWEILNKKLKEGHYYLQRLSIEQCKDKGIDRKQFSAMNNGQLYLSLIIRSPITTQPQIAILELISSSVTINIGRHLNIFLNQLKPFQGGAKTKDDPYELDIHFFTVLTEHYYDKSTPFELINKLFSLQKQLVDIYKNATGYDEHDMVSYHEVFEFFTEEMKSKDSDNTIEKIIVTMTVFLYIIEYNIIVDYRPVFDAFKQYFVNSSISNETRLERLRLIKETQQDMQYEANDKVKSYLTIEEIKDFFSTIDLQHALASHVEKQEIAQKKELEKESKIDPKRPGENEADFAARTQLEIEGHKPKEKGKTSPENKAKQKKTEQKSSPSSSSISIEDEEKLKSQKISETENYFQQALTSLQNIQTIDENLSKSEKQKYDKFETLIAEMSKWQNHPSISNAIEQANNDYRQAYQNLRERLKSQAEANIDNIIDKHEKSISTEEIQVIDASSIRKSLDAHNEFYLTQLKTNNRKIIHGLLIDARKILESVLQKQVEIKEKKLESRNITAIISKLEVFQSWLTDHEKRLYKEDPFVPISSALDTTVRSNTLTCNSYSGNNPHELIGTILGENSDTNIIILDCPNFIKSDEHQLSQYKNNYDKAMNEELRMVTLPSNFYAVIKEDSLNFLYPSWTVEDIYSDIYIRIKSNFCPSVQAINVILVVVHVDKCPKKLSDIKMNCLVDLGLRPCLNESGEYIYNGEKIERERICELFNSNGVSLIASHDACGYDDMFIRGMAEWTDSKFDVMQRGRKLLTGETKGGLGNPGPAGQTLNLFNTNFRDAQLNFKIGVYKTIAGIHPTPELKLPSKIFKKK